MIFGTIQLSNNKIPQLSQNVNGFDSLSGNSVSTLLPNVFNIEKKESDTNPE